MKEKTFEVARSFGGKVNIGDFQNRDFFCSLKGETTLDKFEETADELYRLCRKQVEKEIEEFKAEGKPAPKEVKKETVFKRTTNTGRAVAQNMRGVDADYSPMDEGNAPKGADRDMSGEQGGDGNPF